MAGFNLTANINARLVNVKKVSAQLKQAFSSRTVDVKINIDKSSFININKTQSSLNALYTSLQNVSKSAKDATTAISQLGTAMSNAAGQSNSVANASAKVNNNLNQQKQATRAARTEMQEFGRVSGLALRRFAGFSVATTVVFGFGRAITSALSDAISFERELIKVAQVTGKSVASLTPLTNEITRLSKNLGVASSSLVKVSRILSQSGLSIRQTRVALEALAKTDLAPTFKNIETTADGAIAIMRQFGIGANQLEQALGAVNAVAGKFAVESDDIIAAVKRAGGVFAATSKGVVEGAEALNQFIAIFTSVRATTREGAETIATGLRTIFTRIQRPSTIKFLQQLGINLQDAEGKFVGGFEAANRLAKALRNLDPRDARFAQIIEELGGFRQVGKVIPIITAYETRLKALQVAQQGASSLTRDQALAQETLQNKLIRVKEEFVALIREVTQTSTFRVMANTVLNLASALIRLADSIKPIIPLLGALGTIALFKGGTQFVKGFGKGVRGQNFHDGGLVRQKFSGGGDIRPRGLVPGGKGIKDDVRATLQEGEFVIRRKAVDAIGVGNLKRLNRADGGRVELQGGGILGRFSLRDQKPSEIGAAILRPEGDFKRRDITIQNKDILGGSVPGFIKGTKKFGFTREALGQDDFNALKKVFSPLLGKAINSGTKAIGGAAASNLSTGRLLKSSGVESIFGNLFEAVLANLESGGIFDSRVDPNRPFDFVNGFTSTQLRKRFSKLSDIRFIDAKASKSAAEPRFIRDKVIQQLEFEAVNSLSDRSIRGKRTLAATTKGSKGSLPKKISGLAGRLGRNQGGDVPALLTRGEFVVNKRAAKRLGGPVLHRLNNYDRIKRNQGGEVGRQPLVAGGVVKLLGSLVSRIPRKASLGGLFSKGPKRALKRTKNAVRRFDIGRGKGEGFDSSRALSLAFGASTVGGLTENQALTEGAGGAALGATVASGLGAKGKIVGIAAAVGGLFGLFKGNQASKINAATEQMDKVFDGLDSNLQKLNAGGSIEEFRKNTKDLFDVINQPVKAGKGEGFFGFTDFLGRGSGAALTSIASGATTFGKAGGVPGALAGTIIGAGLSIASNAGSPEEAVTRNEVLADITRREGVELAAGKQFAERTKVFSDVAQSRVASGLASGLSDKEILASLSAQERIGLAANVGGDRTATILSTASASKVKTRQENQVVLSNIANKEFIKTQREIVNQQERIAQAARAAAKNVDLFTERLLNFNAAVKRADNAGINLDKRSEALLSSVRGGAGIFSGADRRNVFGNTRAFSQEEIAKKLGDFNNALGNTAQSRELVGAALGAKVLQTQLPNILNDLQRKRQSFSNTGDVQVGAFLKENLSPQLRAAGTPQVLIDSLIGKLESKLGTNRKASPRAIADALQDGTVAKFAESIGKPINEALGQWVDAMNNNLIAYEKALDQWIGLLNSANQAQDKVIQTTISNENRIRAFGGRGLSAADRNRGFRTQVGQEGRRAGIRGGFGVGTLANQLNQLDQTQLGLQAVVSGTATNAQLQQLQNLGIDTSSSASVADAQANVSIQQNAALKALTLIANNTSQIAESEKRLLDLEKANSQALSDVEKFATASPAQRAAMERNSFNAQRLLSGASLSGEELASGLEGLKSTQNLRRRAAIAAGRTPEEVDLELRRERDRAILNSDAGRILAPGGFGVGAETRRQQRLASGQASESRAAGTIIADRRRRQENDFRRTNREAFDSRDAALRNPTAVQAGLTDSLNKLNSTMTNLNIPSKIEIGGTSSIDVRITGLQDLADMQGNLKALVVAQIDKAIKTLREDLTGEAAGP